MTVTVVPAGGRAALEVALVGRANAGKTSLFMHLTGTAQRPVNFPGTSVERVRGTTLVDGRELGIVDLPGISSLRPMSQDERVTLEYLRSPDGPDVICAVVDAAKLAVEIELLRGLVALGKPIVIALNKVDVARNEGRPVNAAALAEVLQIPVIETDGLRGHGFRWLGEALLQAPQRGPAPPIEQRGDAIALRVMSSLPRAGSRTDALDAVLLHRWFGLPLLLLVMFGMFQLVFTGAEPFVAAIELAQDYLSDQVAALLSPGALRSFAIDGLIHGVGSIVSFLPQIALLIALVAVLEASGYMARAAFLLDRVLSGIGLSGRSFVPLTTSFACAIPGILASRIIPDERDRIATVVVSPLMSCSARLPVYVVLIGAFFPVAWAGLVLLGLYMLGIVTAVIVALLLRRTVLRGGSSPLIMELPNYERPAPRVVWGQVRGACREFIKTAGSIILLTSIVIWFLSYYPRPLAIHEQFEAQRAQVPAAQAAHVDAAEQAAYLEQSYLARAGKAVQPIFAPAGFDWRATVGVLAAFPARELIVPTLGILCSLGGADPDAYSVSDLNDEHAREDGLRASLIAARRPDGSPAFDRWVALSLMVFFSLCSQCVATLATIRRETRSWRWPVFTFTYMTAIAWVAAVVVYQVGTHLGGGA